MDLLIVYLIGAVVIMAVTLFLGEEEEENK